MAKRSRASAASEPEPQGDIVRVENESQANESSERGATGDTPRSPGSVGKSAGPGLGERLGRFFRFLGRLVLLLIFLGLLSVALYFALPLLYERFLRPLEQNTLQVRELQVRQEQTAQELSDLQSTLADLESNQGEQDSSLRALDERLLDIENEIAARSESLAALETLQTELKAQNEEVSAELERQIGLLKAMELLSRARLSMYQSNFGLARQDVQIGRDLLASIRGDAPATLQTQLDAVILRLDMTLANLPAFPVVASDDLDIAWQILLSGLPQASPAAPATPTPTPSPTPGLTDTPVPSETAAPSPTP